MRKDRLTTAAHGVFCALIVIVVLAHERREPEPVWPIEVALAVAPVAADVRTPALAAEEAARESAPAPVVEEVAESEQPVPEAVIVADDASARTWVTLQSEDGTVYELEYEVASGDTLGGIGARFDVPFARIMLANGIRDVRRVRIGQRLRIPLEMDAIPPSLLARLPERLRNNPERLRLIAYFDRWARTYGIDPTLLKALSWVESGWQHNIVSHKGAIGIGQLMPDTVDFVGNLLGHDLDPWAPEHNIRMSARFLRYLLDETDDVRHALAAYYQGLGAFRSRGVYRQTRPYIENVLAAQRYFASS